LVSPHDRQVLKDTGIYGQDQIRYQELLTLALGVPTIMSVHTRAWHEIDNVTTYRAGLTLHVGHEI